LVIDLIFLQYYLSELNNHFIYPEWHLSSDHAPLTITILISDKIINMCKITIRKNSIEEESFIKDIISSIKILDISNLLDIPSLEKVVNNFAKNMDNAWSKNVKLTNITKHSKSWWDNKCSRDLERYRASKSLEN